MDLTFVSFLLFVLLVATVVMIASVAGITKQAINKYPFFLLNIVLYLKTICKLTVTLNTYSAFPSTSSEDKGKQYSKQQVLSTYSMKESEHIL